LELLTEEQHLQLMLLAEEQNLLLAEEQN